MATDLGIEKPQQIIAGIDDNFFVTEHPVIVDEQRYAGKTLFVSLLLLKSLSKEQANAVIVHELAHFGGKDTLYSKKISPLLCRYEEYLNALYQGGISRPMFYFMLLFWSLYQISLQRLSRQRELRADGIAAKLTSPQAITSALVKVTAYSSYRNHVEQKIFETEEILTTINMVHHISTGFPEYIKTFVSKSDISDAKIVHPFDSHPPLKQRSDAVGIHLSPAIVEKILTAPATESWYQDISVAKQLEEKQWEQYKQRFRQAHEHSLAYRYLPANDEEQVIVEKYFPAIKIEGNKGDELTIHYLGI